MSRDSLAGALARMRAARAGLNLSEEWSSGYRAALEDMAVIFDQLADLSLPGERH